MSILATQSSGVGIGMSVLWIVIMFVALYFMMIRPQQKETKKKNKLCLQIQQLETLFLQPADFTEW